jgi:uncharacterized protein (TIGR03032 family)
MNTENPFEIEFSPQIPEILNSLGISLALSTYQAGKVIFISSIENNRLVQLPRTFASAMGMAVAGNLLAIATKSSIEVLNYSTAAAVGYPMHQGEYDGLFLPRCTYHTGYLAAHDMAFIKDEILAINTMFSAICKFSHNNSFDVVWKPPFISQIEPEDRCHLNGMAVENGEIRYVTALGNSDKFHGWRDNKMNGGILMEYPSGKIILDGLAMPHSPRIFDDRLFVLNSAQGTLLRVDRASGDTKIITNLGAFARGMDRFGDYLFIGTSKLRHNNEIFRNLPIAETSFAGVVIVHLPTGTIAGTIKYSSSVEEIYDVKVLVNKRKPNILSPSMEIQKSSIIDGNQAFWTSEEKKDEPSSSEKPSEIQLQLMKNIAPAELEKLFGTMIGKDLSLAIRNGETSSKLNLAVVSRKANPLGLLAFEAKLNKTVRVWSVFVKTEERRKGIATLMLKHLQVLLNENDIQYSEAEFTKASINEEIIKKLFSKFGEINLRID